MSLRSLADLRERATRVADAHEASERDDSSASPNVVVPAPKEATLEDGEYVGADARAAALLAGALRVVDEESDASLHFPDPRATAVGPWLVLEPLGGLISTVHAGRGRVRATVDPGADVHETLSRLFEAAGPDHEHYPVDADERGVFTTGMEPADLRRVEADRVADPPEAHFDVRVTPSTRAQTVRSRFGEVTGVVNAEFEIVTGVERARPSTRLRDAVEAAHERVRDTVEYEWGPEPTTFSHLPSSEKVALGAVDPGASAVGEAPVDDTAGLLETTLAEWREGER